MGCAGARGSHKVRGMWQPASLASPSMPSKAPHGTAEEGARRGVRQPVEQGVVPAWGPVAAGADGSLQTACGATREPERQQGAEPQDQCKNLPARHAGLAAASLPSAHEFLDCVGSDFSLACPTDGHLTTLRLVRVQTWRTGILQGCSLHFTGPHIGRPVHATYVLWHQRLGRLSLFLGPVQTAGAHVECLYEAVITHLHSPLDKGARHE